MSWSFTEKEHGDFKAVFQASSRNYVDVLLVSGAYRRPEHPDDPDVIVLRSVGETNGGEYQLLFLDPANREIHYRSRTSQGAEYPDCICQIVLPTIAFKSLLTYVKTLPIISDDIPYEDIENALINTGYNQDAMNQIHGNYVSRTAMSTFPTELTDKIKNMVAGRRRTRRKNDRR